MTTLTQKSLDVTRLELVKDIVAFASILIKMECDDILANQSLFREVLNEAGFRTTTGKEFSKMSFRNLFSRLSNRERAEVVKEFMEGHRDADVLGTMFA